MATSPSCAACGCQLTHQHFSTGQAAHYGNAVYCAECARLVLGQNAGAAAPKKKSGSAVRRSQGIETIEELNISVAEQPPQEYEVDEAQTFSLNAPHAAAAPAPRVPHAPQNNNRLVTGPVTNDVPFIYEENIPEAAPPLQYEESTMDIDLELDLPSAPPARNTGSGRRQSQGSGRHSSVRKTSGTHAKQSGRQAAVRPPSRVGPAVGPGASGRQQLSGSGRFAAQAPEKKISNRSGVQESRGSGRQSAVDSRASQRTRGGGASGRSRAIALDEVDDPPRRGQSVRTGKVSAPKQGMSAGMMLGIGLGGVFFLVLCIALFSGSGDKDPKKKATAEEVFDDKTPSNVYAKKAQDLEKAGDKLKAADFYEKAANQAEREKAPSLAQKYGMHAYQLRKFSTLNMSKGR